MSTRKIRDESEYQSALEEIERLLARHPSPGSGDADRLDILSLLVSEYEHSRFPIDLPSPVDAIKFRMDQLGLKQRDLVSYIGSRSRVSEVLNGRRPLSLTMIRALHRGLGIPAAVLLQEEEEDVETSSEIEWDRFPIREMARLRWINAPRRSMESNAEEIVREFARPVGGIDFSSIAMLRRTRTVRSSRRVDPYALAAWCTRVKLRALELPLGAKFDEARIDDSTLSHIAQLSSREEGPCLVGEVLSSLGIHFVVEPHLSKTHLDGAALFSSRGDPIVALTLRHDRIDSFWFSLLHELAHIRSHLGSDSDCCIDDLDAPVAGSSLEAQADRTARECLVPTKRFRKSRAFSVRTPAAVIELASRLHVHPAVVAGRIRFESRNYRILNQLVGQGEVRRLFPEQFGRERE